MNAGADICTAWAGLPCRCGAVSGIVLISAADDVRPRPSALEQRAFMVDPPRPALDTVLPSAAGTVSPRGVSYAHAPERCEVDFSNTFQKQNVAQ